MYKSNIKNIKKLYTLAISGLVVTLSLSSCGKTKDVIEPTVLSPVSVYFNNAYKGLVTENQALAKKDPNNPDKKAAELISLAKESLDFAIYDIQDPDLTKTIINAKKKGIKVRIVTDTTNTMVGNSGVLRESIKQLKDAGIEIKDDKRSAFMHHKFIIADNKSVWTGAMNFTTKSLYDHNNDSIMIDSEKLAQNYKAEFDRLFDKGQFAGTNHEIPYPEVNLAGNVSVKTFFSPEGGTTAAITKELTNAKKSIKFMAFAFTNKDIANLLITKSKQKVVCEGIYDSCQIGKYSTYDILKTAKLNVYRDGNQALMHEKTFIIDSETVITGSFNFSASAEKSNNENTLIIKSAEIAKIFDKEYERLKYASLNNKNLPPYDHPACKGSAGVDPKDISED